MIQVYNFSGSWQLFPEKGIYESGERPRSGIYRIEAETDKKQLLITHSWTLMNNQGFTSRYRVPADGRLHDFDDPAFADKIQLSFTGSISFELHFYRAGQVLMHIVHEIMPNGYLKITRQGFGKEGAAFTNIEIFHRQMSVLPYSASVAGAVIRPTEEGVIRHKALTAMEEQTNMQLDQIRRQIELLALQAQEIYRRKELSSLVYHARLSFKPEIGQRYYLYRKEDESHILSLISPEEWGDAMPYRDFVACVQLLADHTWREES